MMINDKENTDRLAKAFLDEALMEANEIVRLLKFYQDNLSLLDQHDGSLKKKTEGHKDIICFKIGKAKEWYMVNPS